MAASDIDGSAGRRLGFERLAFFSDAVFAIAITLLVLDLKPTLDPGGGFALAPMIPNLIGFALSFYVVGRYWLAHHALLATVQSYDRQLLVTNLLFLASIAFLPFPTSVVALAKADTGPVAFYAVSVAGVGLLMILLALAARREALMRPGETRGGTAYILAGMAAAPAVFLAAAFLALYNPRGALFLLLALIPAGWLTDRVGRMLQHRIDAVPQDDASKDAAKANQPATRAQV
jgi:uncharacterized membrane protein